MRIFIFLVLFIVTILSTISKADVGWTKKVHYPTILTKNPKEIRVMVIDTGISAHWALHGFLQDDDSLQYSDPHGHGTHVAGIIIYGNEMLEHPKDGKSGFNDFDKVCKLVKIFSCKAYDFRGDHLKNEEACVYKAIILKMDVINISGGGVEGTLKEYLGLKNFTKNGGSVVVAAGNEHFDLAINPWFPASYAILPLVLPKGMDYLEALPRIYVVQAKDRDGKLLQSTNRHPAAFSEMGDTVFSTLPGDNFGLITGTSQAAPTFLHKMLKQKCEETIWN